MSHRVIQQWNQWLNQGLGVQLLNAEKDLLEGFLNGIYGKHVLLIGVPAQGELIKSLLVPYHLLLSPLLTTPPKDEIRGIESTLNELPIASGSVSLVVLPHSLELVDNPRQVLSEACRIVQPEGHIIICGFNPFSLWGVRKWFPQKKDLQLNRRFHKAGTIINWLNLADFELIRLARTFYRPPLANEKISKSLRFLEWIGRKCHLPWGGVYMLMARAKVVPLTPIRWRWKQSLAAVTLPTSLTGPSIRNSK